MRFVNHSRQYLRLCRQQISRFQMKFIYKLLDDGISQIHSFSNSILLLLFNIIDILILQIGNVRQYLFKDTCQIHRKQFGYLMPLYGPFSYIELLSVYRSNLLFK